MRILACGDRKWSNRYLVRYTLTTLWQTLQEPILLIEGGALGADRAAGDWADQMRSYGVEHMRVEADWETCGPWCPPTPHRRPRKAARGYDPGRLDTYCPLAGPHRNMRQLMEGKPELVLAFHGDLQSSKGTKHMVDISEKAGVEVWLLDGKTDRSTAHADSRNAHGVPVRRMRSSTSGL